MVDGAATASSMCLRPGLRFRAGAPYGTKRPGRHDQKYRFQYAPRDPPAICPVARHGDRGHGACLYRLEQVMSVPRTIPLSPAEIANIAFSWLDGPAL